jgi:uncharacterized membrane protein YedE/YeeE
VIGVAVIKKFGIRDFAGNPILFHPKDKSYPRYILGGTIFGLGWAITGACPGPLFAQFGTGGLVVLITFLSALAGTWVYGYSREKLPH